MAANLQGEFLVASNHLRDPNFFRTVVLVLEHDRDSAMGLVINRPSSISVDTAIAQFEHQTPFLDPMYSGGPVDTESLFILHNAGSPHTADSEVAPGIFLTGSHDSLDSLINSEPVQEQPCRFRIYCGYAGWGQGQLESEIDRGDWRTLPAAPAIVFESDPYEVWEVCTHLIQQRNRLLPHDVKNPEWN